MFRGGIFSNNRTNYDLYLQQRQDYLKELHEDTVKPKPNPIKKYSPPQVPANSMENPGNLTEYSVKIPGKWLAEIG